MKYDRFKHHRRSIRLKHFDYASAGAYFVNVVVNGHLCLLGEIVEDAMRLNEAGRMVDRWWTALPTRFANVQLDAYIIMPNHVHGIIVLTEAGAATLGRPYAMDGQIEENGQGTEPETTDLMGCVGWFKTMSTNAYIRGVHEHGWEPFARHFWQRNYWERIIRNQRALENIRRYIELNPIKWANDPDNPTNLPATNMK
jgi:REP element-mobilizing transposase RayT